MIAKLSDTRNIPPLSTLIVHFLHSTFLDLLIHIYLLTPWSRVLLQKLIVKLKPSQDKVLTGFGDLREVQVDFPLYVSHSRV